jgi:molybdenum cofactor cytidylyltransferase
VSQPALYALVLAAGQSSRYGEVKQLVRYRGQSLVARALREAETVCAERTILISGNAADAVHAACHPLRGFLVHNDNFESGIASSITSGIAAVAAVADGVLITLADQPLVTREHLAALAALWQQHPEKIIASRYAGTNGVPAIFPCSAFPELLALRGDQGARPVIDRNSERLLTVEFAAAARDIDYPADLDSLERDQP